VFLDYEGDGSFISELPGVESLDDYGKSMEIKLREKGDPQDLLKQLVGRIAVHKFEVKEPTLNAIFIDKVGAKNEKNTLGH